MNVWSLAARNLARNRRRTLLTGGIVVVGFSAIALAGGFMAQTFEGLREGTIRGGAGHVQLAHPAAGDGIGAANLAWALEGGERIAARLSGDSRVLEVLPRTDFVGLASNGTRSLPFLGSGLDGAREARVMDFPSLVREGRWLRARDDRGVVLGRGLARALESGLGRDVTLLATTPEGILNAIDAEVVGIAEIPVRELDERYVAVSLGLAADLLQTSDRVSKLVVVLRDTADTEAMVPLLLDGMRAEGVEARALTWRDLAVFYGQVRVLYLGIFGFMGAVLVGVVLLATANTMLMAASERTREIGTLRALGTRSSVIRHMFLAEGVLLGCAACVVGAALSTLIRLVLNRSGIVMPPPPGLTTGFPLHLKFYVLAYAVGAAAMIATLALASYLASRKAARMSIVGALAHV